MTELGNFGNLGHDLRLWLFTRLPPKQLLAMCCNEHLTKYIYFTVFPHLNMLLKPISINDRTLLHERNCMVHGHEDVPCVAIRHSECLYTHLKTLKHDYNSDNDPYYRFMGPANFGRKIDYTIPRRGDLGESSNYLTINLPMVYPRLICCYYCILVSNVLKYHVVSESDLENDLENDDYDDYLDIESDDDYNYGPFDDYGEFD